MEKVNELYSRSPVLDRSQIPHEGERHQLGLKPVALESYFLIVLVADEGLIMEHTTAPEGTLEVKTP